jgi:hypothetical protein
VGFPGWFPSSIPLPPTIWSTTISSTSRHPT